MLLKSIIFVSLFSAKESSNSEKFKPFFPQKKELTLSEKLGQSLFFDANLSRKKNMSCATCHNPGLGFGDAKAFSNGTHGNAVGRHTPHLFNLENEELLFWDGRAEGLKEQVLGPIQAKGEMDMSIPEVIAYINSNKYLKEKFQKVFQSAPTKDNIATALAHFVATIKSGNSAFDKYLAGDKKAMTQEQINGFEIFKNKGNCGTCHDGINLTDGSFHNIGVKSKDEGRFKIVKVKSMKGAFRTPGLRNVELTAPYMHNGSLKTLEEVVDFYDRGGDLKTNLSKDMKELNLTEKEKRELVSFLKALTGQSSTEAK